MDLASRETYAQAVARLDGLASGQAAAALAGVGAELLAVANMLAQQPRLRRALADPARSGDDRAGLLEGLIAGKVAASTATLARALVTGRWSSASALLTAFEELCAQALLASAEVAGELAQVEDELFRFGQLVNANNDLAAQLGASTVASANRSRLANDLLAGKVRPVTQRLVELALRGLGGRGFTASLSHLIEAAAQRRDRQIAYVTVAKSLTEPDQRRLETKLAQVYGRKIDIKLSIDSKILGGARVRVGHDLYDGTVSRRLAEAKQQLGRPS